MQNLLHHLLVSSPTPAPSEGSCWDHLSWALGLHVGCGVISQPGTPYASQARQSHKSSLHPISMSPQAHFLSLGETTALHSAQSGPVAHSPNPAKDTLNTSSVSANNRFCWGRRERWSPWKADESNDEGGHFRNEEVVRRVLVVPDETCCNVGHG